MPTLRFSQSIRRKGRQVVNASTSITKIAAKQSLTYLVNNTKVDTGLARSNWRVGVGAPTRVVIEPYVKYPKRSKGSGKGISEKANASAAISAGRARIDSIQGKSGVGLTTGIFITNNTPYIDKAMKTGSVQVAIAVAMSKIANFKIFDEKGGDNGDN
jgi:hypothetical protein